MSAGFDEYLDGQLGSLASFARTAGMDQIQRVATRPRRLTNKDAWPPEVWAEMQAIWNEEQSHDQQ